MGRYKSQVNRVILGILTELAKENEKMCEFWGKWKRGFPVGWEIAEKMLFGAMNFLEKAGLEL